MSDYEAAGISADELAGTHNTRFKLRDDRGELELCFHDDERIIQILATPPMRDIQDVVFSLIEVPMVMRALDDIWRAEQVSADALAKLPPFDVTFAMTPDQDAALLVDVLSRFANGEGPFTAGDAARGVEAIQRLRVTRDDAASAAVGAAVKDAIENGVIAGLGDVAAAAAAEVGETLRFVYRNYRGEIDMREVRMPIVTHFGATDYHPEPQWLVTAFDVGKGADRTFALRDMRFLHDIFPGA